MSAAPEVEDDDELPRRFGSYLLLQNFARGGMGEVYLAKSGGIAGLERTCVLKKLRSELTRDREYVTRFIDEARVVVTLSHANICNVFDVGRVVRTTTQGRLEEYYLAMDYVSGRDLRTLQDRCKKAQKTPAPGTTLHLVCETLQALDYAHRRKHPNTGEPLNLVHRDVSPQNVLVSYEGEVKLIDFGLAASRLKVERTQPNVVMGKMAYMAPEQARGDPIDARADLFACGVMCYEMLANERFYEDMTAADIWQVAGRGGFVPRAWSTLDPALTAIIWRAVHPEPKKRFSTCGDFREALLAYSHERWPGVGERALRALMEELFVDEIARERATLTRFGTVTIAAFHTEAEATESRSITLVPSQPSPIHQSPPRVVKELEGQRSNLSGAMPAPLLERLRSTDEGTPLSSRRPDDAGDTHLDIGQTDKSDAPTHLDLGHDPDDVPDTHLDVDRLTSSDLAAVPNRSGLGERIHEEKTAISYPSPRAPNTELSTRKLRSTEPTQVLVREHFDSTAAPDDAPVPSRLQRWIVVGLAAAVVLVLLVALATRPAVPRGPPAIAVAPTPIESPQPIELPRVGVGVGVGVGPDSAQPVASEAAPALVEAEPAGVAVGAPVEAEATPVIAVVDPIDKVVETPTAQRTTEKSAKPIDRPARFLPKNPPVDKSRSEKPLPKPEPTIVVDTKLLKAVMSSKVPCAANLIKNRMQLGSDARTLEVQGPAIVECARIAGLR